MSKRIEGLDVGFLPEEKEAIRQRMDKLLDTGHLMMGEFQAELAAKFCDMTKMSRAVTFNSCSSAHEVFWTYATRHMGVRRCCWQANVFPSPVFAAIRAGVMPVWVDIDPEEACPTVTELQATYDEHPFEALCLQWTGGFIPHNADAIIGWARHKNVIVLEDVSQALGSRFGDQNAGSLGDHSITSLAGTKPHLQCGHGGMLMTDDPELAGFAFRMKNYGRTEMFSKGEYVDRGWNMHMTEMQALIACVTAETMKKRVEYRTFLAKAYRQLLPPGIRLIGNWDAEPNVYKVLARVEKGTKDAFKKFLEAHDIGTSTALYDWVTPYLAVLAELRPLSNSPQSLKYYPGCEDHAVMHVGLPMHNRLEMADITRVIEVCRQYVSVYS